MGATCGCTGKEDSDEYLTPPTDLALLKKFPFSETDGTQSGRISIPTVDLEKEFDKLIENVAILNPTVNAKRKQLGPFKFRTKNDLSLLNLVNNDRSATGESYFGFMYFYNTTNRKGCIDTM